MKSTRKFVGNIIIKSTRKFAGNIIMKNTRKSYLIERVKWNGRKLEYLHKFHYLCWNVLPFDFVFQLFILLFCLLYLFIYSIFFQIQIIKNLYFNDVCCLKILRNPISRNSHVHVYLNDEGIKHYWE